MKKVTFIKTHKSILKIEISGEDQYVDDFIEEFEKNFNITDQYILR